MSVNRRLVVLLVLCCSLAVLTPVSTAGVSSVSASRGVAATVSDDSEAYLGVTRDVVTQEDSGNTLTVAISNRVPNGQTLSVSVELSGDETRVVSHDVPTRDTVPFQFTNASCDATLAIVATGPTTRIELERAVPCSAPT